MSLSLWLASAVSLAIFHAVFYPFSCSFSFPFFFTSFTFLYTTANWKEVIVWWIVNTVSLSCYKDIGQKSLFDWGILNQILPLFRTNSVLFFFLFLWVLQWVALSSSHMISKIYTLHYILTFIHCGLCSHLWFYWPLLQQDIH